MQKLFLGTSLKSLDTDKISSISNSIADELITKIQDATGQQGQQAIKQKSDAIKQGVAEASGAAGAAGYGGPFGQKEKKNVKRRT